MRKIALTVVLGMCSLCLAAGIALAQSSGNFSYGNNSPNGGQNGTGNVNCVLTQNGNITGGGATCQASCTVNNSGGITCIPQSGTCGGNIYAGIKTSSGNGNVFVVRPSMVIGLLTDVSLLKNNTLSVGTSSALAGVNVTVTATGESNQAQPSVIPNETITYDARFVQISSNLFDLLSTTCTSTSTGCYFNFNESTVSAHSFDWLVGAPNDPSGATLSSGQYGITMNWAATTAVQGLGEALTCVGPINLTVQQNKIFNFNTVNSM